MKKNYKAGDKVRVKTFKERPGCWNVYGLMDHLMGKVVTVKEVTCGGNLRIDDGLFYWTILPEHVEPVKNECIVVYRKGNKVIALNKTTGKKAEAKCNPADMFDFYTGARLAFDRLTGRKEKESDNEIKVGDCVKIIDTAKAHRIDYEWVNMHVPKLAVFYAYTALPHNDASAEVQFKVLHIAGNLAYIQPRLDNLGRCYLFELEGLKKC